MMRRAINIAIGLTVLGIAAVAYLWPRPEPDVRATLSLSEAMGIGDTIGWQRATEPRPFSFPADHGPHTRYRTEWWYFTGNLHTTDGRRFGFQLTFFRSGLAADSIPRSSSWAARDAYMAHFAITDATADEFHAFDAFARGAAQLAGATAQPFRVWLHDWEAAATGAETFPLVLRAQRDSFTLELTLEAGKPPVLNGEAGLSRKGPSPGNATYYYSMTRLPAHGTIRVGDAVHEVSGLAWMDREWGTSALEADRTGWDWFALQLADSTELMLYRIRPGQEWAGGTFVDRDGSTTVLSADAFTIDELDTWRSPLDGARYPSSWHIRVSSLELEMDVTPVIAAQELNLSVRYWEGAVEVRAFRAGRPVEGRGYVELTGYAGDAGDERRATRGGRQTTGDN